MAGLPTALAGAIVHEIAGQPAVEATRLSISFAPPLNQRFGFAGQIGTSKGQAGTQARITFAGAAGKQQFNLLAMAAQNAAGDLGFDYTFWDGAYGISNRWLIPNCFLGEFNMDNDPQAGTVDKSVMIMGGPPKQIQ
jgi:hypothetical protein